MASIISGSRATESDSGSPVTLRGTQRGLEIEIEPGAGLEEVLLGLRLKLEESPGFFAGCDVILRFLGEPLIGSLGPLEALTQEFDLQIVSIRSPLEDRLKAARAALAVVSELADGSGPAEAEAGAARFDAAPEALDAVPEPIGEPEPSIDIDIEIDIDVETDFPPVPEPFDRAQDRPSAPVAGDFAFAQIVLGPIRSGSVLESERHLVIFGDVNPGAEVRSAGSIAVFGRLRGVAHAGASQAVAAASHSPFIVAQEVAPQQLRIGELVARPGDADGPEGAAEIAYATGGQIVVERYRGSLPRKLWSA
jgi:septum formation inhibitor MinC